MAGQQLVARMFALIVTDAHAGRGIALRIEVDQQHPAAGRGERGGEVDRGRGLADPAFLVCNRDPDHLFLPLAAARLTPSATMIRASGSVTLGSSRNAPCHEGSSASSSVCAPRPLGSSQMLLAVDKAVPNSSRRPKG